MGVKDAWLAAADRPEGVEHVFAMDADDVEAIRATAGQLRAIGRPPSATGTPLPLVRAVSSSWWSRRTSRLPGGWDSQLAGLIGPLDPTVVRFAVKLTDAGDDRKVLLRHPVVSRAFYARFGLFDPAYDGLVCDEDLTTRAFWKAMILDGRSVVLQHRHPLFDPAVEPSESHLRMSSQRSGTGAVGATPASVRYPTRPTALGPAPPPGGGYNGRDLGSRAGITFPSTVLPSRRAKVMSTAGVCQTWSTAACRLTSASAAAPSDPWAG